MSCDNLEVWDGSRERCSIGRVYIYIYIFIFIYTSHVQLFATLWTVAHQTTLSMRFSRQEYRSTLSCPPPGDLPNSRIEPTTPAATSLQVDSLLLSHWGSLCICNCDSFTLLYVRKKHIVKQLSSDLIFCFKARILTLLHLENLEGFKGNYQNLALKETIKVYSHLTLLVFALLKIVQNLMA